MDLKKLLDILQICLPVFALIGLGKFLQQRGTIGPPQRAALNSIVYYLSLPALVFCAVVNQHIRQLLNPVLIVGTIGPTLIIALLYLALTRATGNKGEYCAVGTFGSYWANIGYMGFPLAKNAFGADVGIAYAGVVNAFAMPVFVFTAMLLGGLMTKSKEGSFAAAMRNVFLNPVIIAVVIAILIAVGRDATGLMEGGGSGIMALKWLSATGLSLFNMLGAMGLPLALISVGAAITLQPIRDHRFLLGLSLFGKLILAPLFTYIFISMVFPDAGKEVRGVAVLLMAMPNAVVSYVISSRMGFQPGLVSGQVALSTLFSMVTIPIWLYFLL